MKKKILIPILCIVAIIVIIFIIYFAKNSSLLNPSYDDFSFDSIQEGSETVENYEIELNEDETYEFQ